MTLTTDPLRPQLSIWRLKQDIVLLIYLNTWWSNEQERPSMPYTLGTRNGKKVLLDQDGHIACEFEAVGSTFHVVWYRSWDDYEHIDQYGQEHAPRRVEEYHGGSKAR